MSTPNPKVAVEHTPDPAMEFWPRVEQAINAAGVSRFDMEWIGPTCHKKNCKDCHIGPSGDIDQVMYHMKRAILESVHTEMLCRAISEPDYGDDE